MSRRIVSTQLQAEGAGKQTLDTYFDRVTKYIPSDIVAAWVAVTGLIAGAADIATGTVLWIAFAAGLVLTYLWTRQQTSEQGMPPATTQTFVATGSFAVWVFALGGPFAQMSFYRPIYGSLLLIFYSLVVGLIVPKEG